MKNILLSCMFGIFLFFCMGFCGEKIVFAEEMEVYIELSEEEAEVLYENIGKTSQGEKITKELIWVSEEAPDNILSIVESRSSDYESRMYGHPCTLYTEVLGVRVDIATIYMLGEMFFYTDGKVHLYSMKIDVDVHCIGWSSEISDITIINTDGTVSYGNAYVDLTNLINTHRVQCSVRAGNGSDKIYTNITQIY